MDMHDASSLSSLHARVWQPAANRRPDWPGSTRVVSLAQADGRGRIDLSNSMALRLFDAWHVVSSEDDVLLVETRLEYGNLVSVVASACKRHEFVFALGHQASCEIDTFMSVQLHATD